MRLLTYCGLLFIFSLSGQDSDEPFVDVERIEFLQKLQLEDILNTEVTTASRRPEQVFRSASAVTVITREEIRRSGARTIPDALRLAPGMEVGRLNGNQWAISTRGFNDRFSNKLLVMVDGRSVYLPTFSGVYWDLQDVLLEDIDRIEVVRGPGAALWGSNAVNGVVHIITKDAKDTLGGYVTGGYGTEDQFISGRYGFDMGDHGYLRGYVKHDNFDELDFGSREARDSWYRTSTGLRTDWIFENDQITVQGDYLQGRASQELYLPTKTAPFAELAREEFDVYGGNLLGRWMHRVEEENELQFQAYYDYSERKPTSFDYQIETFDVDFQHRFPLNFFDTDADQKVVWGLGYRFYRDYSQNFHEIWRMFPPEAEIQIFSAFLQDEVTLADEKLKLTLGLKVEHHQFSGFEYQPNFKVAYFPTPNQTWWASIARSVRTPNRAEEHQTVNHPLEGGVGIFRFTGDERADSEKLLALELGYRFKPTDRFSLDIASYYFFYEDLVGIQPLAPFVETPPAPGYLVVPFSVMNEGETETYGAEVAVELALQEWWKLRGGYNYFGFRRQRNASFDNDTSPENQLFLRSSMDYYLSRGQIELDFWLRYRDELKTFGLDDRFDLDSRLAWSDNGKWEIAVVGRNLLGNSEPEFGSFPGVVIARLSDVPRSVYLQLTHRF